MWQIIAPLALQGIALFTFIGFPVQGYRDQPCTLYERAAVQLYRKQLA